MNYSYKLIVEYFTNTITIYKQPLDHKSQVLEADNLEANKNKYLKLLKHAGLGSTSRK